MRERANNVLYDTQSLRPTAALASFINSGQHPVNEIVISRNRDP